MACIAADRPLTMKFYDTPATSARAYLGARRNRLSRQERPGASHEVLLLFSACRSCRHFVARALPRVPPIDFDMTDFFTATAFDRQGARSMSARRRFRQCCCPNHRPLQRSSARQTWALPRHLCVCAKSIRSCGFHLQQPVGDPCPADQGLPLRSRGIRLGFHVSKPAFRAPRAST
jgi:hypothetical protein